jgi:SnoaL-like polyketide cyclase
MKWPTDADTRQLFSVLNSRVVDRIMGQCAERATFQVPENRRPLSGRPAIRAFLTANFLAYPDWTLEVEKVLLSGDEVAVVSSVRGTHTGPLTQEDGRVVAPTGEAFTQDLLTRVVFDDNARVQSLRSYGSSHSSGSMLGVAGAAQPIAPGATAEGAREESWGVWVREQVSATRGGPTQRPNPGTEKSSPMTARLRRSSRFSEEGDIAPGQSPFQEKRLLQITPFPTASASDGSTRWPRRRIEPEVARDMIAGGSFDQPASTLRGSRCPPPTEWRPARLPARADTGGVPWRRTVYPVVLDSTGVEFAGICPYLPPSVDDC